MSQDLVIIRLLESIERDYQFRTDARGVIGKLGFRLLDARAGHRDVKPANTASADTISRCTTETPCCDRRDQYNGFHTGPRIFECPKGCACHD